MPRYRFAWTNLSDEFLAELAGALGLRGEPAEALRSKYGARPKERFVQDAWPFLRDGWLAEDDVARSSVVDMLVSYGLGATSADVDTPEGEMAYLRSCRNALSLRQVVLGHFLELGEGVTEQAGIMEQAAKAAEAVKRVVTREREPEPAAAPPGADGDGSPSLEQWVAAVLADWLDVPEIKRDDDGDMWIPAGSAVVFVRAHDDEFPSVEVFSPLLRDFKEGPAVFEAVNAINVKLRMARVMVVEGPTIILQADIPAGSLDPQELIFTVQMVGRAADHFDTLLQARFGGETMFEEDEEDSVDV